MSRVLGKQFITMTMSTVGMCKATKCTNWFNGYSLICSVDVGCRV